MQGLFGDFSSAQVSIPEQRAGGGKCVVPTGTDRCYSLVRIDYLACSAENEQPVFIGRDHHGFQLAHHLITAPVLGQGYSCFFQVSAALLQFFLKFFAQGESIGDTAGKTDNNFAVIQTPYLSGGCFKNGMLPHCYLAVSGNGDLAVALHGADGCSSERTGHRQFPPVSDIMDRI